MSAPVLLGIIAAIFGIAPIILRSNAVYILLAVTAGDALTRLASQDVTQVVSSIITVDWPVYSIVQIVLLTVLPLLILFWYRKSVKADIVLHIVPAIAAVLLCFMFITTMLPYDTQKNLQDSNVYSFVKPYFELAIAAGLLSSAIWFWAKKPKREKHDKKKHQG